MIEKRAIDFLSGLSSSVLSADVISCLSKQRIVFTSVKELSKRIDFKDAFFVADYNTECLLPKNIIKKHIYPANVKPLQSHSYDLSEMCDESMIVAFGSGTICDIAKYAALLGGKVLVVVATAPSMNGYCSKNASLIDKFGKKISISARPVDILLVDLDILRNAPVRLIRSGVGDMLCAATIRIDCLYGNLFFDEYHSEEVFAILLKHVNAIAGNIDNIISGDINAIRLLMEGLIVAGLCMVVYNNSSCSSRGEHAIADILQRKNTECLLHGEAVAYATAIYHNLQKQVFMTDVEDLICSLSSVGGIAKLSSVKKYYNFLSSKGGSDKWMILKKMFIRQDNYLQEVKYILSSPNDTCSTIDVCLNINDVLSASLSKERYFVLDLFVASLFGVSR